MDWQGAIRNRALVCSLGCPGQLKVGRIPGQCVEACAVGGCYLFRQHRFPKAGSPCLSLNSLGPIRLHGGCASSRLTACPPDPLERGRQRRDREASGPSPACTPDSVDCGTSSPWERRVNVSLTQPGTLCSTFRVCEDKLPARHMAYYKSDDRGLHMNMNTGSLYKPNEANELPDWQN